jgi:hydroxypyruvate isomerase
MQLTDPTPRPVSPSGIELPTLSVMLWPILPHEPFERRIAAVAEAGYRSVQLYDEMAQWTSAEHRRFRQVRDALGIAVDAICAYRAGFSDPAQRGNFLDEVRSCTESADSLSCRDIIVVSGDRVDALSATVQRQASIDTLNQAADIAASRGCRLFLESINPEEAPEGFLNSVTQGFDIVGAVARPNVRMLFDFFHEQMSGGNLISKLTKNAELVGLVHLADVPGRHEPGTGEINYRNILQRLFALRFTGSIAMEFKPTGPPVASLRAAREYVEDAWRSGAVGSEDDELVAR